MNDTKMKSFQYTIIYKIMPCNKWLNNMKIKKTDSCDNYKDRDINLYYFIKCAKVADYWSYWCNQ